MTLSSRFAGLRWRIAEIDHDNCRVEQVPASVGQRPRTRCEGSLVHDRVRAEMRVVLAGVEVYYRKPTPIVRMAAWRSVLAVHQVGPTVPTSATPDLRKR